MKNVSFTQVDLLDGFWKQRQKLNHTETANILWKVYNETGRLDAFTQTWKEDMPNKPHIFWDSDVAKWIEGVSYILEKEKDADLQEKVEWIIDQIEAHQDKDGYYNSYFQRVEPTKRFHIRDWHELYCAGHLMEAACAYYHATGRDRFLKCMCRYADYIEQVFVKEKSASFSTPGHEEIELALVKLYQTTGEERYLALSKFFVDTRGTKPEPSMYHPDGLPVYMQSHIPVREQTEAIGHAVRACYLYTGMADLAYYYKDEELKKVCDTLYDNIVNHRMYVTGGVGSTSIGEAFTMDYDLSNTLAYTETCASIALAYFAHRMQQMEADSSYADTIERIMYNGFLAATSLSGKEFYYNNPLEIMPKRMKRAELLNDCSKEKRSDVYMPKYTRSESIGCSCCPPNILRFAASIGDYIYTVDEQTTAIYCHQFMASTANLDLNGQKATLEQKTEYPFDGKIVFIYHGPKATLKVRIPAWADSVPNAENGYASYAVEDGSVVEVNYEMKVKFVEADPRLEENCGRYAVSRGPLFFCMEGIDNGENLKDIRLEEHGAVSIGKNEQLGVMELTIPAWRNDMAKVGGLYSFKMDKLIPFHAKLIPYYAMENRGLSEMIVWCLLK